jgi:hypothetical protein
MQDRNAGAAPRYASTIAELRVIEALQAGGMEHLWSVRKKGLLAGDTLR